MIDGHQFFAPKAAILAGVVVANEHVLLCQRDALRWATDIIEHTDNRWQPHLQRRGGDDPVAIVDDLRFAGEEQLNGTLKRGDIHRLVGKVQNENFTHGPEDLRSSLALPLGRACSPIDPCMHHFEEIAMDTVISRKFRME